MSYLHVSGTSTVYQQAPGLADCLIKTSGNKTERLMEKMQLELILLNKHNKNPNCSLVIIIMQKGYQIIYSFY